MRACNLRYFESKPLRIIERVSKDAISLSVARNRPVRSFGAVTAFKASSLMDGSARKYISVVCMLA